MLRWNAFSIQSSNTNNAALFKNCITIFFQKFYFFCDSRKILGCPESSWTFFLLSLFNLIKEFDLDYVFIIKVELLNNMQAIRGSRTDKTWAWARQTKIDNFFGGKSDLFKKKHSQPGQCMRAGRYTSLVYKLKIRAIQLHFLGGKVTVQKVEGWVDLGPSEYFVHIFTLVWLFRLIL